MSEVNLIYLSFYLGLELVPCVGITKGKTFLIFLYWWESYSKISFCFLTRFCKNPLEQWSHIEAIDWFIILFVGLVAKFWFKCTHLNSLLVPKHVCSFYHCKNPFTNNCTYTTNCMLTYILKHSRFVSIWCVV